MIRDIPLTIRQLQLFREAEQASEAKIRAVQNDLNRTIQTLAAGIVAGFEAMDQGAEATLVEWRADPPRLVVKTDEEEPSPETEAFVREALEADAATDQPLPAPTEP